MVLRRAEMNDLDKINEVESKATPNLRYLEEVFDQFVHDEEGELIVAEIDGEVVGCAKFTVLPDKSAWLESLRVIPAKQGLGLGKRFYKRFFELAKERNTTTMRMYTGEKNVVSKGLAERFGFSHVATYRGMYLMTEDSVLTPQQEFVRVDCPQHAWRLVVPRKEEWGGFLVMNRTFYALTPALITYLVEQGMVYENQALESVIILGARFMPEQALHIGLFAGSAKACLEFAQYQARELGVQKTICMFPPSAEAIEQTLAERGFERERYDCIVMGVNC